MEIGRYNIFFGFRTMKTNDTKIRIPNWHHSTCKMNLTSKLGTRVNQKYSSRTVLADGRNNYVGYAVFLGSVYINLVCGDRYSYVDGITLATQQFL